MKCVNVLLCLLTGLYARAQGTQHYSLQVTDADTYRPLAGAVISYDTTGKLTDNKGNADIYYVQAPVRVSVSLLGYEIEKLLLQPGHAVYKIALKRKYAKLNDVEIRTKKLRVDSLIRLAAMYTPTNYLRSTVALPAQLQLILLRGKDTALLAQQDLWVYNGKKDKWIEYYYYRKLHDSLQYIVDSASYDEVKNYVIHWKTIPEKGFALGFFSLADELKRKHTKYKVVVSTFMEHGDKYYDIVLMSNRKRKTKYSLTARMFGYGGKHNPNSETLYIGISEQILNSRSMAVSFMQSISVVATEEGVAEFMKLNNRSQLRNWLDDARSSGKKYTMAYFSFAPVENDSSKWIPEHCVMFDNYQHVVYRGDSIGDYTYVQQLDLYQPQPVETEKLLLCSPWTEVVNHNQPEDE